MRTFLLSFGLLSLAAVGRGQPHPLKLPCEFSGELLRTSAGEIVRFSLDEMKARATYKVDLNGFVRQMDFRSTVIVDVLVGVSGEVICTKSLIGIPIARQPVEKALQSWKFKPAILRGKPVVYVGLMEFTLCNMDCGKEGFGVTLLK